MKRAVKVHMIADDALMNEPVCDDQELASDLCAVATERRRAARRRKDFLRAHKADLNERGAVDLAEMYG